MNAQMQDADADASRIDQGTHTYRRRTNGVCHLKMTGSEVSRPSLLPDAPARMGPCRAAIRSCCSDDANLIVAAAGILIGPRWERNDWSVHAGRAASWVGDG